MKILLKIILIFVLVNGCTYSQSAPVLFLNDTVYFPLNINNKWQFLRTIVDPDGPSYSLDSLNVEMDTIIGEKKYYRLSDDQNLYRYCVQEKKLYEYWQDSEYVNIDFTVPNGQSYMRFIDGQYKSAVSESGTNSIFFVDRAYGGYLQLWSYSGYRERYSDSIGITYSRSATSNLSTSRNIFAAVIYDSLGKYKLFSGGYKPGFAIVPLLNINTSLFSLIFNVSHPNNRSIPAGSPPWHHSLNYIDSVMMYSFYSKDDSIIHLLPVAPINSNAQQYSVSINLDTALMKNGFNFNYRFTAKDKGIIPAYSSAPDTGYYKCIWSEPTDVINDVNNKYSYSLEQNFPNPFNPFTSIRYSTPQFSQVIIKIFDILGNEIEILADEEKPAGKYELIWNAGYLPSGVYFYQLKSGLYMETRKMILMR